MFWFYLFFLYSFGNGSEVLLNLLAISEEFLTVLLPIWTDVTHFTQFLYISIMALILSHVLNKFNLFLWNKSLKWFALLFCISLSIVLSCIFWILFFRQKWVLWFHHSPYASMWVYQKVFWDFEKKLVHRWVYF